MSRQLVSPLTTTAMVVGALFLAASPVLAGGGGGGHGGGGGGGHGGGFSRGYGGGYGRGYYGGGYGRGYYGGYYGRGYYGGGYGGGYYSNGAGPSYSAGSSGYLPSYATDTLPTTSGYYSPPEDGASSAVVPSSYDTAPADTSAHIRMEVPASAEIWIDGAKTLQTGSVRNFVSPPLNTAHKYSYEVTCRWLADGRPVEITRQVSVRANTWTSVDFTRSDTGPETIAAPKAVRAPGT
jgi:uncharacterized protein (TIGR03000 family)